MELSTIMSNRRVPTNPETFVRADGAFILFDDNYRISNVTTIVKGVGETGDVNIINLQPLINSLLRKLCEKLRIPYEYGSGCLEDRAFHLSGIQNVKPTRVFDVTGMTGRPNADQCESNKTKAIRTSAVGILTLADVCRKRGPLMMNLATGRIFELDAARSEGFDIGFKEEGTPNFAVSLYSKTKAVVEGHPTSIT